MNFLAEVLSTAGETQMTNIKDKIPKIVSQIGKLKSEVVCYLKNLRIDFKLMKSKSNALSEEASKLNNEMQALTSEIDMLFKRNVQESRVELENLKADLEESSYALELLTQLVDIDNYFKQAKDCLYNKAYLDAMIIIETLNKTLNKLCLEKQLDIIPVLTISASIEHETILNETGKVWHESVIMEKTTNDYGPLLTIKINISRSDELKESIKALCYDNPYFYELQGLSNFLMKEIFTSIINYHCIVEINDSVLSVKVNEKLPKQPYNQVFGNIANVIDFISVTINFEVKEDVLLLSLIGQKINEQFCEMLIKNTLADTIPSTGEELEKYSVVAEKIETLQKILTECQFFSQENQEILAYAKNVDVLFANKACQIYLDKARMILKKDLHDMIEVGTDHQKRVNLNDSSADSVLVFPKCYISRNVLEYLDLIREVLVQASLSSDLCGGRFVFTADEMVRFYYCLIPDYHKKLLESIPQQVALFHNNCMYIAHETFTFNKHKGEHAIIALKELNFSTHNDHLKAVATESFMKYIQTQIEQIEDILKQLEFTKLGETDQIDPNYEKYIRQCLRQLELLKTVWQKVLSYEVYNKTIGQLLNSFVGFLIELVVGVEDISAINCTLLVEVFGIVKTRGPKLFTEPKEIHLYVKQWYKFNELTVLLNSSLADINDRWADAKGPLAVEFTPDEVKGLIRALFQNTERRAAVLVRIN